MVSTGPRASPPCASAKGAASRPASAIRPHSLSAAPCAWANSRSAVAFSIAWSSERSKFIARSQAQDAGGDDVLLDLACAAIDRGGAQGEIVRGRLGRRLALALVGELVGRRPDDPQQ